MIKWGCRIIVVFIIMIFLLQTTLAIEPHIKLSLLPKKHKRAVSRELLQLYKTIEKNAIITFYCPCYYCTGKHSWDKDYMITASGVVAKPWITAALPQTFPFGTLIKVHDQRLAKYTFVCEDRGSAIIEQNGVVRIDIFVNSHEEALKWGVIRTKVSLILR